MKVSVIIPCYNGEEFIGQAIGSVLEQSRPVYEIIVVDDGSTDRSAAIAREFGKLVTVLSKGGGGAARARTCGADYASGDALMFLDADDVLGPDVIRYLTARLVKNPGGVVSCPWYRLEKIDEKWVQRPPSCEPLGENQDYLSGWLTGWYHLPCSILWSRNAYEKMGGWDPLAYVNDDGDLMMRALVDGIKLQITDKGKAYYRKMPSDKINDSLSGARFTRKGRQAQIYVVKKIAQRLSEKNELNTYRKPITIALEKYQKLCMKQYPDLSKACADLIDRYGEPAGKRILRDFGNQTTQSFETGKNKLAKLLSQKGFKKTRRALSGIKNTLAGDGSSDETNQSASMNTEREVTYGLSAYRKSLETDEKGKVAQPQNPEISVLLSVTNTDDNIENALKSVLWQSFSDFELLVVVRESDTGNKSLANKTGDSRVRIISSSGSAGSSAMLNRGMREVKGWIVAFMDPKDEWLPEKLTKESELFRKMDKDIGILSSRIEVTKKNKKSIYRPALESVNYGELLGGNKIHSISGITIRRDVIPATGFFDEQLPFMGTDDYIVRTARYYKFKYSGETLLKYQSSSGLDKNTTHADYEIESRRIFFEKHCIEMRLEKVAQKFLLDTARLELKKQTKQGKRAAKQLAFRALKENLLGRNAHRFIFSHFTPRVGKR